MSEVKLKPCPFCGGEAKLAHRSNGCDEWFLVICANCNVSQTGYTQTECQAVEAWNARKPIERIVERLEEKAEKAMNNSEKAAELGQSYERHMIFNGAKGNAFEEAIEIVKEEGECYDRTGSC